MTMQSSSVNVSCEASPSGIESGSASPDPAVRADRAAALDRVRQECSRAPRRNLAAALPSAVIAAAEEAGIARNPDFNGAVQELLDAGRIDRL